MTSLLNTYIDALKPVAKTFQKTATKVTDLVDETLEKTQQHLKKQQAKVSEPQSRLWISAGKNSLGEIIDIPTPVPINTPIAPLLPMKSRTLAVVPEPDTVLRRRSQRARKKNDSENDNEQKQQINHSRNEIIEKCLNDIIDIITITDDLVEQISTEDNSRIVMESVNINEENVELSETQSTTTETDLSVTTDVHIEQPDPCETSVPSYEQLDSIISESLTQQTYTELSTMHSVTDLPESPISPIIDTQENPLIEEKKRFSVVNCYTIPSGTIISHMSCSSTYIYICTNQRSLLYAKFPTNDPDLPLQWYRYPEPAERLIVSTSNQTVWRSFNKRLYSSTDSINFSPMGIQWREMKFSLGQSFLSISINDQCGWYIKADGTLWLIRIDDRNHESINIPCPFYLNNVVCSIEKIGVMTNDGQILVRIGCTYDCLGGDGWIFVQPNFGPLDDFALLKNDKICIIDKKHRLWIHQWSGDGKYYEVLCNDNSDFKSKQRYLLSVNEELLCFCDSQEQMHVFSDALTGIRWSLVEKNTRLQRLIGAFTNENHVWALTTSGMICSSNGHVLEKPRQAQYLTHATFVPDTSCQGTTLWSLDESCNIYVRNNVEETSPWEQLDQIQFHWNRRLVHMVCNSVGVWAVDDRGCIHFRHGHVSNSGEYSLLNPAWISIPGEPKYYRLFAQIFCGPEDWMVYATDNKQNVYARIGINENNCVGTSWRIIEDCSALELAISEHTLWLLTSHGRIQCRENISIMNPTGTRSTTLPGRFHSMTVSMDDSQVWALNPQRHLFKLDRLTMLFEK